MAQYKKKNGEIVVKKLHEAVQAKEETIIICKQRLELYEQNDRMDIDVI